jgi:KipI family sensor histidine kinase inhibitor
MLRHYKGLDCACYERPGKLGSSMLRPYKELNCARCKRPAMMTRSRGVRFLPASDQSLMIYFGEEISLRAHECVVKFLRLLEREPISIVRNVHPGYCSVLVKFDALACTHAELEAMLRGYVARLADVRIEKPRLVEIPVCYGGEFGPDIEDVCALHGLTAGELSERHSAVEYLVYFLGFVPGFAYLGRVEYLGAGKAAPLRGQAGLKGGRPSLPQGKPAVQGIPVTPRLAVPRRVVPAGSVGIAGVQTGVYPFATPGGWRLIGRTPMRMFSAAPEAASVLSIGDRVRFVSISPEKFAEIAGASA